MVVSSGIPSPDAQTGAGRYLLGGGLLLAAWWALYLSLPALSKWFTYTLVSLAPDTRLGAAVDAEVGVVVALRERKDGDERRAPHARQRVRAIQHAVVEPDDRGTVGVARLGRAELHRQHVIGAVPGVHGHQPRERSQEQPGADEQHQRDGDLGHGKTFVCKDPDGHVIELYYETEWYDAPPDKKPALKNQAQRYPARGWRRARATACISSQAGCAVGCPFCATGQAGLTRNLSTAEIVDQVKHAAGLTGGAVRCEATQREGCLGRQAAGQQEEFAHGGDGSTATG